MKEIDQQAFNVRPIMILFKAQKVSKSLLWELWADSMAKNQKEALAWSVIIIR
jgi:hypothetical protein